MKKCVPLYRTLRLLQVGRTPQTSLSFVIRAGALIPGERYVFALSATDAGGTAVAEVPADVARAPRRRGGAPGSIGSIVARVASGGGTKGEGIAFATTFALSAADWAEEDLPLSYQFQYLLRSDAPPVVLAQFQPSLSLSGVTLPAGFDDRANNVTLQLCVPPASAPHPSPGVASPCHQTRIIRGVG